MIPWDPLVPQLVELLRARLAADGSTASDARCQRLVGAVQRVPLTCKEAAALFRREPVAKWLLFYVNVPSYLKHVQDQEHVHLYDGVPSTIDFDQMHPLDDVGDARCRALLATFEANANAGSLPATLANRAASAAAARADLKHGAEDSVGAHRVAARALVVERYAMRAQLENGDAQGGRAAPTNAWGLCADYEAAQGLPDGTPARVRQLVGFVRFQMALARLSVATAWDDEEAKVATCARKGCPRVALFDRYYGPVSREFNTYSKTDAFEDGMPYWETCRTGHGGTSLPDSLSTNYYYQPDSTHVPAGLSPFSTVQLPFCCRGCRRAVEDEHVALRGGASFALLNATEFVRPPRRAAAAAKKRKTRGSDAVEAALELAPIPAARLFAAALDRNQTLLHRLTRRRALVDPTHLPTDAAGARSLRRQLVDSLNVDTALLYAASVLAELPEAHRPKKRQPNSAAWRQELHVNIFYFKAISEIRKILRAEQRTRERAGLDPELPLVVDASVRWMQAVKTEALRLF